MKNSIFSGFVIFLSACVATKQAVVSNVKIEEYHQKWIKGIDDPKAKFDETLENFKQYFSGNNKGLEIKKEKGGFEEVDDFFKFLGINPDPNILKNSSSAYEIKMFKGWYFNNKNWIKSDGTIMSMSDRQNLLDKQQEELKKIEQKNKKKGNGQ